MKRVRLLSEVIDLEKSELLYDFAEFKAEDWSITRHAPPWKVSRDCIIGGQADERNHGQIFYKTPVRGDTVLEFDAELVGDSYHDFVWWWATSLDRDPWGEGYLGCLGGWWNNCSGIEKSPTFTPCSISPMSPIRPGRKYHIVSGGIGCVQFIVTDGVLSCYMTDPAPATKKGGHFGFGVYSSHVKYSNLKVYRPHWERTQVGYLPDSEYVRKNAPGA